jgi:hypothetical protein
VRRFWDKVQTGPGCWEWQASRDRRNGYGWFWFEGKMQKAHRVSYRLNVGPIPEGLQLDHLCRNRGCVNPAHLEPVTSRENTLRGDTFAAAQAARTHCPQGHEYTEENTARWNRKRYCRACHRSRNQKEMA